MISYGTVTEYDRDRRAGVIKPDVLGAPAIVFTIADQPESGPEPVLFQHYSYSVHQPDEGGQARAVSLRRHWYTQEPRRECEMDLDELLHAHQAEVIKAGASGDECHLDMIAEYADRIGRLRTNPQGMPIPPDRIAPPAIIYGSYAGSRAPKPGASSSSEQGSEGSICEANENPDRGRADVFIGA